MKGNQIRYLNRIMLSRKNLSVIGLFLDKSSILSSETQKFPAGGLPSMPTTIFIL